MLNLVKYDFRKISTLFYSLFIANVILHIAILILDRKYGWWDEFSILGAISITSTLLQVLHIIIIYNFNATLKSITRRLLPISAVKEYISHLIVPVSISILFFLEFLLFTVLLNPQFRDNEVTAFVDQLNITEMVLGLIVFTIFYSLLTFMFYFLAVAITRLFKTNAKVAIFIGILFIGSLAYTAFNEFIKTSANIMHQANIRLDFDLDATLKISFMSFSWTTLIDIAIMIGMSLITVYIMKNKLEA